MRMPSRRTAANLAIAAAVLALVASIGLVSGRTEASDGLGYDGVVYATMMVESLDRGSANPRMRPLVVLTNQLAYDFIFHDPIRTFQAMNFVYSALLALVLCGILDLYGVSLPHKLLFTLNIFSTIAVVKMFAFYPVLVDLGAYLWVTLAVYAILRGRRAAIVATTVLWVFAREFGASSGNVRHPPRPAAPDLAAGGDGDVSAGDRGIHGTSSAGHVGRGPRSARALRWAAVHG